MKIRLTRITPDDERRIEELRSDEVVSHEVELDIDGKPRTFEVFLRAGVLREGGANLVYGDTLVEELFRFDPTALSVLCRTVARSRRGQPLPLPLVLVGDGDNQYNQSERRASS